MSPLCKARCPCHSCQGPHKTYLIAITCNKAAQGTTGQAKTGEDRAERSRAGQDTTEKGRGVFERRAAVLNSHGGSEVIVPSVCAIGAQAWANPGRRLAITIRDEVVWVAPCYCMVRLEVALGHHVGIISLEQRHLHSGVYSLMSRRHASSKFQGVSLSMSQPLGVKCIVLRLPLARGRLAGSQSACEHQAS